MTRSNADSAVEAQVAAAAEEARTPLDREQVAEIISSVLSSMEGDISAANIKLYHELDALARYIQAAKEEIASIRPDEIRNTHIPSATDELDAVVGATEEATGQILDACEEIETLSTSLPPEHSDKLTQIVTRVYEASNFQDVTGQRITKVVKTLRHIEDKVDQLLSAFGDEIARARHRAEASGQDAAATKADPAASGGRIDDKDLLNGPSLPNEGAIDQAEIDRLLSEFD